MRHTGTGNHHSTTTRRPPCASATSCPARSTTPPQLVEQARRAEEAGFEALWISDHFHPWNDEQGQSPFVWSRDRRDQPGLRPAGHHRRHLPDRPDPSGDRRPGRRHRRRACCDGRFTLGVGTGEALNEHILGDPWPTADVRLEMLEEAVRGDARSCGRASRHPPRQALPRRPRPHLHAARAAARRSTSPGSDRRRSTLAGADRRRLHHHRARRRAGRAVPGEVRREAGAGRRRRSRCAPTEDEGVEHAHRLWPNAGLPGELAQVLPTPRALRAGLAAGHRGRRPASRSSAAATSTGHLEQLAAVRRAPATTSCTSPTWARTTAT